MPLLMDGQSVSHSLKTGQHRTRATGENSGGKSFEIKKKKTSPRFLCCCLCSVSCLHGCSVILQSLTQQSTAQPSTGQVRARQGSRGQHRAHAQNSPPHLSSSSSSFSSMQTCLIPLQTHTRPTDLQKSEKSNSKQHSAGMRNRERKQ